jgi:hypothetical protein
MDKKRRSDKGKSDDPEAGGDHPIGSRVGTPALILCLAAAGIRLIGIAEPPFKFHPTKQFQAALFARALFWKGWKDAEPWQKELGRIAAHKAAWKEPPILEFLASLVYRLAGAEKSWIPRLFSIIFWLAGAILLHRLAVFLYGPRGALLAPLMYLFLPFGVQVGRAFMPEALLSLTFLWAILALVRYAREPTTAHLLRAATVAGLAILVKFIVVFPLWGAFAALEWRRQGLRKALLDARTYLFPGISSAIGLVYYAGLLFGSAPLRSTARAVFIPALLGTDFFWKGWLTQIGHVTGLAPFVMAFVAILLVREQPVRAVLVGLFGGYFLYGLAFSYSTATHDYYQIALFGIVLLAWGRFGPELGAAWTRRGGGSGKLFIRTASVCAAAGLAFFSLSAANSRLLSPAATVRWSVPAFVLYGNQLTSWTPPPPAGIREKDEEIGRLVGHSAKTIFLAYEYGYPLRYFGGIEGEYWPDRRDVWARGLRGIPPLPAAERFVRDYWPLGAEFFIIEDMDKSDDQPDLRRFLEERHPLFVRGEGFLIFDLRRDRKR